MPDGKDGIAQAFYLAQLQACKGSCQCNVCKLLRNAADLQTATLLNPQGEGKQGAEAALDLTLTGAPGITGQEE